jgi:hypothetical protein
LGVARSIASMEGVSLLKQKGRVVHVGSDSLPAMAMMLFSWDYWSNRPDGYSIPVPKYQGRLAHLNGSRRFKW